MKKMLVCVGVIILFAHTVSGATVDFTVDDTTVNLLDKAASVKITDVAPISSVNGFMIPVRIAAELLGAKVTWDENARSVSITDDGLLCVFAIGSKNVVVNGTKVELETQTVIKNNRTLVPLQFFTDCMGYFVRVADATNQILITDDKPLMRVGNNYIYFDEVKLLFDADKDKYVGEEELLVKSCISNLYDTTIMCNNAAVKGIALTSEELSGISAKMQEGQGLYKDSSLKSIYASILLKRMLADKFSDYLSVSSIPKDDEVLEYFNHNFPGEKITEAKYDEIKYLIGYENFVKNWDNMYANTDDESYYEISQLTEMLK